MLTTILVNFNHGRYLAQSLGSILSQTRPPDELIVIDDASTDDSVAVITQLLPGHCNARLIQNPVNQGTVANMNDGLRLARGIYVHFAAADDLFYPRLYERTMLLAGAHPAAAVCSSRSDVIDKEGRNLMAVIPRAGYPSQIAAFLSPNDAGRHLMREDGWFMSNTALFRRECLIDVGGFAEGLRSFADGYVCRLLSLKYGACFLPEILSAWRRLDGGFASSVAESQEQMDLLFAAANKEMLKAANIFPSGYAERWTGRHKYDVRRQALARVRTQGATTRSATGRMIAAVIEKFWVALFFVKLRPWDLPWKIFQRITQCLWSV